MPRNSKNKVIEIKPLLDVIENTYDVGLEQLGEITIVLYKGKVVYVADFDGYRDVTDSYSARCDISDTLKIGIHELQFEKYHKPSKKEKSEIIRYMKQF